jgi:hypothetical protein
VRKRAAGRIVSNMVMGAMLGVCVMSARPAAAQSTIFNIPSTDTVSPKKVYFEFDYLVQLPSPDAGGQFSIYAPRGVVGVTPQLEAGVNVFVTHVADGGGNTTVFSPNAKYKFFSNDDKGLAAAAGIIGYLPNNDYDSFSQIYVNFSKKVKSGARFTAGGWFSLSYEDPYSADGGDTGGVLLGYEQPLSGKVSFVADWFSGKNFWGYFTPGVSITLPHSALLNIGYSMGNDTWGSEHEGARNNALFIYYGITFP